MSGNPDIYLFIFSFLSSCIFTNTKLEDFLKFSGLSVLFFAFEDLLLIISYLTNSYPDPFGFKTCNDFVMKRFFCG